MSNQHFALFDTAIGVCGIEWGPRGINGVQLPMGSEEKTRARIRQRHADIIEYKPTAEVQGAIDRIVDLLDGKADDLADIALDLDDVPAFNRGVYDIARTIPPGKTMTTATLPSGSVAWSWRATLARRWVGILVRSWCRVIACSPRATSRAASPPEAGSRRN